MKANTSDLTNSVAARAERLLYRLHNCGRFVSIERMSRIAKIARRCGAEASLVMAYTNGNTNGR